MRIKWIFIFLFCYIISYNLAFADNQTLKVGYWDELSEESQKILKEYPTLKIIGGDMTADTTKDLVGQFLTKDFTYDVFPLFSIQYDIQPLIKKGYLADLSNNDIICENINKMRPDIVSMVSKGSKIYALPYGLETEFLSIRPKVWKNAGFHLDEIPDTFDAFLDFLDIWSKAPVPGYCVINQFDETMYTESTYSKWLLELLFENYLMQYRYSGKLIEFDNPSLKEKMEHCITTGKTLYQVEKTPNNGYALFESGCSGIRVENLVSLRMDKEQPRLVTAYLWMVAVNAESTIKDLAMNYAANVLDKDKYTSVLLFQEPYSVINPYYAKALEEYESAIKGIEEQLTNINLAAEIKQKLQNTLEEYNEEFAFFINEESEYYVTDVQVKEFYNRVDGIYIETPGPLSIGSEYGPMLNQLIASYAAGLLSTDQIISKLDEICWMIQMEEGL